MPATSPIFSHRHYEFLAKFAGEHLSLIDQCKLAGALIRDNEKFKPKLFHEKANAYREKANNT